MKKKLALLLAAAMSLALVSCGGNTSGGGGAAGSGNTSNPGSSTPTPAPSGPSEAVVIQVGFENTTEEPIGKAVQRWAELVEEQSGGSLRLELFPNSALGSKSELIDQMVMGENIITIADGAFYADYGAADMGIMYGPSSLRPGTTCGLCWTATGTPSSATCWRRKA